MTHGRFLLPIILIGTAASAQVRPQPGLGDPRIQTIDYRRDQVVQIAAAPGYQVTVELAPDEQIQTVAVGDSAAWQVTANRSGNLLFVKAAQGGADTNMTVITNARFYAFDLTSSQGSGSAPYEVRFRYPAVEELADASGGEPVRQPDVGVYRLHGARSLRPVRMSDDGEKTYIDWTSDVALPAVFIIDEHGREILANGNMRDGHYVIDSVHDRLLFRIDRETARAERELAKGEGK